ncbi:MAG: PaaI family thioesterase [Candidatus Zixiibacteriota bacterium]
MKTDRTIHTRTAREAHPNCAVRSADDPLGLGLESDTSEDGTTSITVRDGLRFQGYQGRLHGGIISLLFDAAMTHCLFANGLSGVTASLNIRFLWPVISGRSITVCAQVEKQKSHLHLLKGTLHQGGELKSKAEAKFWIVSPAAGYSE